MSVCMMHIFLYIMSIKETGLINFKYIQKSSAVCNTRGTVAVDIILIQTEAVHIYTEMKHCFFIMYAYKVFFTYSLSFLCIAGRYGSA